MFSRIRKEKGVHRGAPTNQLRRKEEKRRSSSYGRNFICVGGFTRQTSFLKGSFDCSRYPNSFSSAGDIGENVLLSLEKDLEGEVEASTYFVSANMEKKPEALRGSKKASCQQAR